jgi:CRP-like cAMP-binding protein
MCVNNENGRNSEDQRAHAPSKDRASDAESDRAAMPLDVTAERLRQNPVFAKADERQLEALRAAARAVRYRPGERVLREGEPADRVYVLVEGRVRIYHISAGGEEVVVTLMSAPAIFGEAEAFSGIAHLEYVDAVDDCVILVCPAAAMLRFFRDDSWASYAFMVDLSKRLAVASYNERSFSFHPSTVRLANYLIDYARWTNEQRKTPPWVINLSQKQMAAAVGITRRSVAKDIAVWKAEGIVRVAKDHYQLDHLEALARYADPERLSILYQMSKPLLFDQ